MLVQGTMNGYGERCGNANLTSIVPNLQLKLGHDCLPTLEGWTEASHYLDELLNLSPDPDQPYVGKNAFAHKGGMHVAGVNADPATFEHIDPAAVGNSRDVLVSELSGKGTVIAHAGGALDDATASRVVERVKELEHRGFQFEAADGSFDLLIRRETGDYEPLFRLESWRVISEKREDGRVQTEATIKIWVDGQRYVRVAEGNGPVNALDSALRAAIGERYPHLRDIKLVNYKVRILDEWKATGATTRVLLDATDGTDTWGAIGVHENVIEASWDALVDSLEAGMVRTRAAVRRDPTRAPRPRAKRRSRRSSRCCAPGSSRSDRGCRSSSTAFAAQGRRAPRQRGLLRHRGAAPGAARRRRRGRRRGRHERRSRSWPPPTRSSSSAPRRSSPTSTRSRSTSTRTPRRPPSPAARRRCCRSHIFGYPADIPAFERHGLPIVEDACEALGGRYADGTPIGSRGHPATFAFYANKQLTTGEGGMITMGSAEHKERVDSERNQGRAPNMDWLDHDRLGFNYRLSDIACALGLAQLDRLDDLLAGRARVAALYREALADSEVTLPCEDHGGNERGWFVFVVQLPRGIGRDSTIEALRARGVQSKPYLPAIHLMSYYRERLRAPRGRVPGVRGRRRAVGRAAVLPAR